MLRFAWVLFSGFDRLGSAVCSISVAFVDDHPVLLSGIAALFAGIEDFDIVGTGNCARDAVEIAAKHQPNVVIADLNMPGKVLEAIAEISRDGQNTKIIAFTAATGIDTAIAALEAGALGYVLKGSTFEELTDAIRVVHGGDTYITPSFASKVIAGLRTASLRRATAQAIRLSVREEQVLRLLLRGNTNKEIAQVLSISDKTVKHYMTVLMQKLNVRNRIEVVLAAQELEIDRAANQTSSMI
jgi:DNA-binding NarL/FixJ family response regulator